MVNRATDATLHLLLASPQRWRVDLQQLQQIWQPDDQLLLMTAAVQGWQADSLHDFAQQRPVGIYQPDADLIGVTAVLPAHLQSVSVALWATWTLNFARCMTWR